jgi:hypothetical protein
VLLFLHWGTVTQRLHARTSIALFIIQEDIQHSLETCYEISGITESYLEVSKVFLIVFLHVYNQYESFIWLYLMVKNREILIESYFKWWTSTKLVCARYQNY